MKKTRKKNGARKDLKLKHEQLLRINAKGLGKLDNVI